jgi:hypothetical protein
VPDAKFRLIGVRRDDFGDRLVDRSEQRSCRVAVVALRIFRSQAFDFPLKRSQTLGERLKRVESRQPL